MPTQLPAEEPQDSHSSEFAAADADQQC